MKGSQDDVETRQSPSSKRKTPVSMRRHWVEMAKGHDVQMIARLELEHVWRDKRLGMMVWVACHLLLLLLPPPPPHYHWKSLLWKEKENELVSELVSLYAPVDLACMNQES